MWIQHSVDDPLGNRELRTRAEAIMRNYERADGQARESKSARRESNLLRNLHGNLRA